MKVIYLALLQNHTNDVLEQRILTWSMLSIPNLKDFVFAIDDDHRRQLVTQTIDEFQRKVMDNLGSFKWSIIHGDFNEQNIIVAQNDRGGYDVSGIIDFGDVHRAPQVFDISIPCTYLMLDCKPIDPLEAPRYVLEGYLQTRALSEEEWSVLPVCVAGRLCQSLTMGAYSFKQDPTNTYVATTQSTGWPILERLRQYTAAQLVQMWRPKY